MVDKDSVLLYTGSHVKHGFVPRVGETHGCTHALGTSYDMPNCNKKDVLNSYVCMIFYEKFMHSVYIHTNMYGKNHYFKKVAGRLMHHQCQQYMWQEWCGMQGFVLLNTFIVSPEEFSTVLG